MRHFGWNVCRAIWLECQNAANGTPLGNNQLISTYINSYSLKLCQVHTWGSAMDSFSAMSCAATKPRLSWAAWSENVSTHLKISEKYNLATGDRLVMHPSWSWWVISVWLHLLLPERKAGSVHLCLKQVCWGFRMPFTFAIFTFSSNACFVPKHLNLSCEAYMHVHFSL